MKNVIVIFISLLVSSIIYSQNSNDEFFVAQSKVGGYGELHYNSVAQDGKQTQKTLDFHRFVLFYSYQWTDKWSFNAEVEIEHNFVDGDTGELELEQAYVNYKHNNLLGFRAGVILAPVGILNEKHEPPTFLTVERPDYSKYIIPTTWFGNGAAIFGSSKGFEYQVTVMEGLDNDKLTESNILKQGIRSGRQKGFKSDAHNLLYNGRIRYTGISGLTFGASYTYNNAKGDSTTNKINLVEVNAQFRKNNIIANAEFGNISYGTGEIEASTGYYFELGYDLGMELWNNFSLIPYIHYTNYNTASSTNFGGELEKAGKNKKWIIGISYLPIESVVFKLDYGQKENELSNTKIDQFNIGVGYMF